MARGLGLEERQKLDQLLRERFGYGLEKGDRDLEAQASAILKRGRVKKAEEYRILETRLDSILQDPLKKKELERISALLASVIKPLPE